MARTLERLRVEVERRGPAVERARVPALRLDAVPRPALLRDAFVRRERACEPPRVEAELERDVPAERVLLEREAVPRERVVVLRERVPAVLRERALVAREVLVREVLLAREAAPERLRDAVARERVPVLRVRAEPAVRVRLAVERDRVPAFRDVLRLLPARDVRDDVADFLRAVARDAVLPERALDAARERELVERERDDVAREPAPRREVPLRLARRLPPPAFAFSRPTSLLKLLFCPRAVWSCTSSARLLSSNLSNQSSHSMDSSESAPL
jgi:hypothetical protein